VTTRRLPLSGPAGRARRQRLLAAVAAPLALAGGTLPAAAATSSSPSNTPHARVAVASAAAAQPGAGGQALPLPGLHAASAIVTLITGDQVRLTQTSPGRYAVSAIPDPATDPRILLNTSMLDGRASLQAIPESAGGLLASGQASRGLFDVAWLASHGDTGPAARLPVTIAYRGHPAVATLHRRAAALPGARLLAASPGSGQVRVSVAAAQAGAFWAALTGTTTAGAAGPSSARLTGGATAVWLTGHKPSTANPRPQAGQAGQPTYPVTITYTRTNGPLDQSQTAGGFVTRLNLLFAGYVLALAGPGAGPHGVGAGDPYQPSSFVCASHTPGKPLPVCTALRITYQLPAGIYYSQQWGDFNTTSNSDHALENASVDMNIPQFTVTGPTALTVNTNNAVPVTVHTPQPATIYSGYFQFVRRLGFGFAGGGEYGGYGKNDIWAVPTPPAERATIGSYTAGEELALGTPPVTAAVTAPAHQALPVLYPWYTADPTDNFNALPNRFTGSHSLQLVDAGLGTAADFSKISARGKLVLIDGSNGDCPAHPSICAPGDVVPAQVANAQKAGAAGVLFKSANACWTVNQAVDCNTPHETDNFSLPDDWFTNGGTLKLPDLPFAEISDTEATMLRGLLAKGPVTVSITDHGETPYLYNLAFSWDGGYPASLAETVTRRDLAAVPARYHDTHVPIATGDGRAVPVADQAIAYVSFPAIPEVNGVGISQLPRSARLDYYGPMSPSIVWAEQPHFSDGNAWNRGTYLVYDRPGTAGTQDWNETPEAPGSPEPATAANQAQPGWLADICNGCRQGNTFYPETEGVNSANPQASDAGPAVTEYFGQAAATVHLYNQAGQKIPDSSPVQGWAAYHLPPGQASYKLVITPPGGATYTWGFTSAEPVTDHAPLGTGCVGSFFGVSAAPCQAAPLVFLRYNAYTSLADTISAPGRHQLQVTGYHQDPSAPAVTSLKLWTSIDGGKTWQPADLTGGHGGTWTAAYTLPSLSQTGGYLSIKAQAADAAGNTVTETIPDAVKLAAPASGPATPHQK
jgi:hypothetical protein